MAGKKKEEEPGKFLLPFHVGHINHRERKENGLPVAPAESMISKYSRVRHLIQGLQVWPWRRIALYAGCPNRFAGRHRSQYAEPPHVIGKKKGGLAGPPFFHAPAVEVLYGLVYTFSYKMFHLKRRLL